MIKESSTCDFFLSEIFVDIMTHLEKHPLTRVAMTGLIQVLVKKANENGMQYRKYGFLQCTKWMFGGLVETGKAELAIRLGKKTQ